MPEYESQNLSERVAMGNASLCSWVTGGVLMPCSYDCEGAGPSMR